MDHAAGHICAHGQASLNTGSTLAGKHAFEEFADEHNVKLKHFHADNHPFNSPDAALNTGFPRCAAARLMLSFADETL